jgi:hypothetical protein
MRMLWLAVASSSVRRTDEILGRPGILLGGARLDLHPLRQLEALSEEPSGGLDEVTHYVVAQREIF